MNKDKEGEERRRFTAITTRYNQGRSSSSSLFDRLVLIGKVEASKRSYLKSKTLHGELLRKATLSLCSIRTLEM